MVKAIDHPSQEGCIQEQISAPDVLFENKIKREWLTTEEASRYLSLTENALRILVHRGKVKAFKLGRRLRFRIVDLRNLLTRKELAYGQN